MKMFTRLSIFEKPVYVSQRDEGMDITIAWQYGVCIIKESSHKGTCMVLIRHYSSLDKPGVSQKLKLSARCGC